jgi:hypothetical protein
LWRFESVDVLFENAVDDEIHGTVSRVSPADLCQHGSRNANERSLLVRDLENGPGTVCQRTAERGTRERVKRLGIEDQRFGQAALLGRLEGKYLG